MLLLLPQAIRNSLLALLEALFARIFFDLRSRCAVILFLKIYESFRFIDEPGSGKSLLDSWTRRKPPMGATATNAGTLISESSQAPAAQ